MSQWKLQDLGWNAFFETQFQPYAEQGFCAGRVAIQHKALYTVYTAHGELEAKVAGKIIHQAQGPQDYPAVGDWAAIQVREHEKAATIHELLPRMSKFSRKAAGQRQDEQVVAANLDTVFIINGLDNDFNLRRLERYLTLGWESGANPVIVLNKADLCENLQAVIDEVEEVAMGVPILAISAKSEDGAGQLQPFLRAGQTAALLGSSGVGKSTIINRLIGEERLRVQEVREKDSRGRHTTSHRELIILPSGALVIDTPGMRELQLWEGQEGLQETFDDIAEMAQQCRFRDCQHQSEPDCAVRQALEDGTLDERRYRSFTKLQREVAFVHRKNNPELERLEKQRWKKIHSDFKKHHKKR